MPHQLAQTFTLFLLLTGLAVLDPYSSVAQRTYEVQGTIVDDSTGKPLTGATIFAKDIQQGTATGEKGKFRMRLPAGEHTLRITFVGYKTLKRTIEIKRDRTLTFRLESEMVTTKEVTVEGERPDQNVKGTDMGTEKMEMEKIQKLPAFLGEVDVLKTIKHLPGVNSSRTGTSGFYVRGGGPDQNLVLLDNAVVYNPSHLFGFFSIFNSRTVDEIKLIKGGMPAAYGSRLASVLDIKTKQGNMKEFQGEGSVGLISSKLTLEGPIKTDTTSIILSGRRTYIDALAEPLIPNDSRFQGTRYFFYDANARLDHRFDKNDLLTISAYHGRDRFKFKNNETDIDIRIPWGNTIVSAHWRHYFDEERYLRTTGLFSDYQFTFDATQDQYDAALFSGIRDVSLKADYFDRTHPLHDLRIGLEGTFHTFTPSNVSAESGDVSFDTGNFTRIYANEGAIYAQDKYSVTEHFKVNAGLRVSGFQQIGPFTRFVENEQDEIVDTIHHGSFKNIALYGGLEPRLQARYKLNERSSVKASYTRNLQYIHLTSMSPVSLPTDVWLPSSSIIEPQKGTQYGVGYFRNFKDNTYESYLQLYYKEMDNLVEFEEGATPEGGVNNNIDNQLTFGKGWSYGAEVFFKKRLGDRFTGWIGYTWSKTTRKFDEIDDGDPFPSKFDRRHDLSVVANYKLNERWGFSSTFVYATGNAITLPVSRYMIEGQVVSEYGERNSFRMPPYNRLDLSANYSTPKYKEKKDPVTGETEKIKKKFRSKWSFSVYNAYNRANPFFLYFDNEGDFSQGELDVSAKQVSLFPILPSVTWKFSF